MIFLTVGDPDQAAPEAVIGATIEALRRNRTGYSPIIGYPQVRAAVAARFERRTGRPCTADNVVLMEAKEPLCELSVRKQRMGPKFKAECRFIPATCQFEDLAPELRR